MAYSKTKPYNRTSYKGAADPSYDRYLKEAVAAGKAENVKESELEKPYNVKQTYSAMQQDYNPVTPPVIDPGPGTGGLRCIWTSTGCEQLVGCWAGSDIVLDGPEAATAGYMPVEILTGDIVSQTVSGSEGRALELIMSPIPRENIFNVRFRDGLGAIHSVPINITCQTDLTIDWLYTYSTVEIRRAKVASDGNLHGIGFHFSGVHKYSIWDGLSWTVEDGPAVVGQSYADIVLDGSDVPIIAYKDGVDIKVADRVGGSWNAPTTVYTLVDAADQMSNLVLLRDSSGYLHIVIAISPDSGDDYVRYITNASGSWADESLITFVDDDSESVGSCGATVVGTTLYIAVSGYYFAGTDYIKYLTGTFGSWTIENADSYTASGGTSGTIPVIFVNGSIINIIHTSYATPPKSYLRHSIKSGTWSTNNVTSLTIYNGAVALLAESIIHCFTFNNYAYPLPTYRIDYFQKESTWVQSVSPIGCDNSLECTIHDSVNNILHMFYSDSTVGYAHAYTYL